MLVAALGCGKSRRLLCHFEKVLDIASVKDRIRYRRFVDSLADYLND